MLNFTAIDFELAQGPRWSICQIGLVRVENGQITHTFSELVKPPENKYSKWNTNIHGINSFITKDCLLFPEIWDNIKHNIENQLVVAHNIAFDIDCLKQTLEFYNLTPPVCDVDCTYEMTGVKLEQLCQALEVELVNHHDALQDALACAKIYLRLKNNEIPDYSKINILPKKMVFCGLGHERIKGDLLKPNLEKANPNCVFFNKKVVFTGVLNSINREEAAKIVKDLGADIDTGITPKTNLVIVGTDPGPSKMKKVEKYNSEGSLIQIIREDEFLKMIKMLA